MRAYLIDDQTRNRANCSIAATLSRILKSFGNHMYGSRQVADRFGWAFVLELHAVRCRVAVEMLGLAVS